MYIQGEPRKLTYLKKFSRGELGGRGAGDGAFGGVGSLVFFPLQSIAIMLGSREHRAFAVETYFSNGRSLAATQRAFRARFEIPSQRLVPGRKFDSVVG